MNDNTMPEHIYAGAWPGYWYTTAQPLTTEYIRADVAQAQLDAANARIAELEAAQAWVSVDERLPNDEDEGVIVWTNNGNDCKFYNYDNRIIPENKFYNYDIGFYHEKNGWMLWTEEWEHGDPTVTHWMPLPPPPVTPET